ncbi:hypothetical protein R3W88_007388 [Solanum pinnatisectum]|uniref:Potassium channel domain-containing protein n=1 Tax=Solanum pinnatisectum TaxID=50273 RepID=A0AAV9M6U7_9SOLN|nr:hypothetical protein R3W88_007388 [Solanum pinnatisectum]
MEKEPLLPSSSSSLNQHKFNFENPILNEPKRKLHRSKSTPSSSITTFNNLENHLTPIPNPPHFLKNTTILKQSKKTHPIVDALYFCILTMCTIGYSDITPNSTLTKLFSILFVLVSLGFYHILVTNLVIYILDSRKSTHRRLFDRQKSSKFLMHFVEKIGWFDSFYFSFMGVTSVGYGAKVFESIVGRIFGSIWLVVSIIVVVRVFILFVEVRVDGRQRKVDKWVMEQDMTVDQFHDGFVSKSDYMIYKLKELGKITERDILLINKQFERLDTGNCGRITLSNII